MTLNELIQEVYTLTGRPDRVNETASAVRAATLKAHQSDYFWKDILECQVSFTVSDYIQQMDYRSIFTLFRSAKYLRKYDPSTNTAGKFLTYLEPEQVLDSYKVAKNDIFYLAGDFIQIKTAELQKDFLFGCYQNPDTTVSGYKSWIAVDHPYAIIYDAAATVFKSIGKDDETANYRALCAEQMALLKSSNIQGVGY